MWSDDAVGASTEETTSARLERLRGVAVSGAAQFGLEAASLDLVLHGFNTTFALRTPDGLRAAVRVNTNSLSRREHVAAQHAWQSALLADTDVLVPDPLSTLDGEPVATVPLDGREHLVVATSWLDGPDVEDCDVEQARALGRVMATMHGHAHGWQPPAGTGLPTADEPLLGERDQLTGSDLLDEGGRAVVVEAMQRAAEVFAATSARLPRIAVHGDLHGGNLKWHEGRLAVFDFDDALMGTTALDLATATFYVRDAPEVEEALWAGYAEVATPPDLGPDELDALLAGRQLLLATSLLTTTTEAFAAMAPEYLERTVARLRHWLAGHRFVLDPD